MEIPDSVMREDHGRLEDELGLVEDEEEGGPMASLAWVRHCVTGVGIFIL